MNIPIMAENTDANNYSEYIIFISEPKQCFGH